MSKIKLTGENSGYVELSAGQNAGNNTLELPTSGTRLVASDNDGNVTIGGTLTYADVTNVDSVGIITAQSGIHVSGGNVGIGTDNPSDKLSIYAPPNSLVFGAKDTTRGNHIFQLLADDAAGNGEIRLYQNSGSGTHTKTVEIASSGNSYFTGGNIGIGTDNPVTDFDISQKTESIVVPVGTDAQRSSSPVPGMLRYSTTSQKFEVYSSTWKTVDVTTPVPTNGLISHWPLDGASINGSNYKDIIGGYDLAITGVNNSTDVRFGTAADWGSPDNNYYLKSASNSYYDFSSSSGLSISIWINSDPNYGGTSPDHQWIVSEGTVNTRWNLFFEPRLKFRPGGGGGDITTNTAASSYQDNTWHHVCCTYNISNDAVVIYLDGVADVSGTSTQSATFSGDYLLFGQHSTLSGTVASYRWRGKMAQCRIYNRVLNASEALLLSGEF